MSRRAITDAVRENQAATDLFDEALSQFLGINRTDGRCLDIIDRHGQDERRATRERKRADHRGGDRSHRPAGAAGYVHRTRDTLDRRKVWVETD